MKVPDQNARNALDADREILDSFGSCVELLLLVPEHDAVEHLSESFLRHHEVCMVQPAILVWNDLCLQSRLLGHSIPPTSLRHSWRKWQLPVLSATENWLQNNQFPNAEL